MHQNINKTQRKVIGMIRDQDEINDKGDQKEQQRDYNDDHDDSMTRASQWYM